MVYKIFSNASKQTVVYLFSILLALLVFMGVAVVYAWTEPTQAPPSGNVSAPVNVGGTTQYKSGAFGVGGIFSVNTFKLTPISVTELGVYDNNNNQVIIFDQGI